MVTARPAARPLAVVGHAILLGVLLCSPVLWTFRETFKGEWEWHVGHDDGINFLQNKKILSLSRENIAWMWNDGVLLGVYEPISWLIKASIVQVGGLTTKAFLVSGLVLHAMTTVLVFFTTRYLIRLALPLLPSALTSKDLDEASVLGALSFGMHPLRVECLQWISANPYLYCGFFTALSLLCHFVAHDQLAPTRRRRLVSQALAGLLSHVFCALAILSKSAALCLPAVLVLLRAYAYPTAKPSDKGQAAAVASPSVLPARLARGAAVVLLCMWAVERSGRAASSFWLPATGALAIKLSEVLLSASTTTMATPSMSASTPALRAHAAVLLESLTWHDVPLAATWLSLRRSLEATHREDHSYRAPTPFIPFESLSHAQRLVKAGYSLTWYLRKTLMPGEIKWNYLLTSPYRATDPVLLLTCLAVVCATLALAASLLRQPPSRSPLLLRLATVSWAAYCLFLLPTLGLVNHSPAYWAADRYSYLPAMVLSPWLAAMYLRWQRATDQQGRKQRNLARVAAVAWLTGLSLQSTDVASRWRTRQSFWEHATRTHSNAIPHYNLGLLYEEKGDHTAAAASFHRALELFPTHAPSFVALALMREKAKEWPEAEALYRKAINAHAQNVPAHLHMGRLSERKGQLSDAIHHYREALKSRPDNAYGLFALAKVYERRRAPGDDHDAESYYRAALIASPESAEVAFRWANLLMFWDRNPRRAKRLLERAIELQPQLAQAQQALMVIESQLDDDTSSSGLETHDDFMLEGIQGM